MLSRVDLPLPDGPITATASPAWISSDTSSRATVSPYSLRTPVSLTTAFVAFVIRHRRASAGAAA